MNTPTTPNLYPLLLDSLKMDTQDPALRSLLVDVLDTYGFPEFVDDDDEPQLYDWVLVTRKGVELGFIDRAYYDAKPYYAWHSEGAFLSQVYFYCGFDDVAPYTGELPYGITWQDDRGTVLTKAQASTGVLRQSDVSDVWEYDDIMLTINYNADSQLAERIVYHLTPKPIAPPADITPPPFAALANYLYEDIDNDAFRQLFGDYLSQDMLDEAYQTDEIDLMDSYGIRMFTASGTGALLLHSITFYANRELDSVGWQGHLPFGLNFNTSPNALFSSVNATAEPRQLDIDVNDGYALWDFEHYSLHVLFSTFTNQVLRVTVSSPVFG